MKNITFILEKVQIPPFQKSKKALKFIENNIRFDITHQMIMSILDSPLNKSNKVNIKIFLIVENKSTSINDNKDISKVNENKKRIKKTVNMQSKNTIIEIDSTTRIPRNYDRFRGLIKKLYADKKIRDDESDKNLLQFVDNIDNELKIYYKIGLSGEGGKISKKVFLKDQDINNKINKTINSPELRDNIAFFMNCIAKGSDENIIESKDAVVKVSDFALSGFVACVKLCSYLEEILEIF